MANTITKGLVGSPDIQFKDSGTTRATFTRPDSDGRTLTIFKVDGADIQFRTIAKSLDDLVDGGYDVPIKPSKIFGGATNTNGHTVPDAADDTFALLAATQTFTNKTITSPTITGTVAGGATYTAPDINGGTVDGITSLTVANDVDIGAFELKAETFESDVATGTAPLTVASTTEVSNLNAAQAGKVTNQGGGPNLLWKVLDIGAWDMQTLSQIQVTHGVSSPRIKEISAMIRQDGNTNPSPLNRGATVSDSAPQGFISGTSSTVITLNILEGGIFDTGNFNAVEFNIDNAAAVDKGGGLVGIPITGHDFVVDDNTTLAGTVNYDATYTIISQTANEIVITATFVAETFVGGGAETASWGRGWVTIGYWE